MLNNFTHQILKRDDKAFPARKSQIIEFMRQNPVGVLSSITPDGEPHGSVIYFAIDRDQNIAFITKTKTRKYQNLQQHPKVTLTCFEASTQTTVTVVGKVEEVKESFDINAIAGAIVSASLKTTDDGVPPITKLKAGDFTAFVIRPEQLHMVAYNHAESKKGYDELFETMESFELHP